MWSRGRAEVSGGTDHTSAWSAHWMSFFSPNTRSQNAPHDSQPCAHKYTTWCCTVSKCAEGTDEKSHPISLKQCLGAERNLAVVIADAQTRTEGGVALVAVAQVLQRLALKSEHLRLHNTQQQTHSSDSE